MSFGRVLAVAGLALPLLVQDSPDGGPAVLTRGQSPVAWPEAQTEFRPYIEVTGVYDTGLAGVAVNDQGQLANLAAEDV